MTPARDFRRASWRAFRAVSALRQRAAEIDAAAVHVAQLRALRERPRDRGRVYHEQLAWLREQAQPAMAAREEAAELRARGVRSLT